MVFLFRFALTLHYVDLITAWDCLFLCISYVLLLSSTFLRSSFFSGFLTRVGVFLGFISPFFALTLFTEPFLFFILQLPHQWHVLKQRPTLHPPPSTIRPSIRGLQTTCLTSVRTWSPPKLGDHIGEPSSYDHRAFAKRHDNDITVLPCTLGEPVCGDERANNGVPFIYFYQVVFKRIGMRLPFSRFLKCIWRVG